MRYARTGHVLLRLCELPFPGTYRVQYLLRTEAHAII